MKRYLNLVAAVIALVVCVFGARTTIAASAESTLDVNARAALLMDADTGTVVFEKEKDKRLQIASMVKIMTLNIVFDEIEQGRLSCDSEVTASKNATAMGGSQAYLDTNSTYKAGELIKSIIVASANDSCVALAEHVAGSVEAFVARMNEQAAVLGMENTYFVNCTGLPAPNQYSCAGDVAKMFKRLIAHKDFFSYSREWTYDFAHPSGRTTTLTNTNKLVRFYEGCDGGKTGFTNEALSCLAATAKREDTRFICVVIGAPDGKKRNAEVCKLFNKGFGEYCTKRYVTAGEALEERLGVSGGKIDVVSGYAESDLVYFSKKQECGEVEICKEYFELSAPVSKDEHIGNVYLVKNGEKVASTRILADYAVDEKNFNDYLSEIINKW